MTLTNQELIDIINSSSDEDIEVINHRTKLKQFINEYQITHDLSGKIPYYVIYYIYSHVFKNWSNKGKRKLSRYQFIQDMKKMYPTGRTNKYRYFFISMNFNWNEYEPEAKRASESWRKKQNDNK